MAVRRVVVDEPLRGRLNNPTYADSVPFASHAEPPLVIDLTLDTGVKAV